MHRIQRMRPKNFLYGTAHFTRWVVFPLFESNRIYVSVKVVGQLGMWGFLISGIQAAALEHKEMKTVTWNGATSETRICLNTSGSLSSSLPQLVFWSHTRLVSHFSAVNNMPIEVYSSAMIILYTVAPLLYRMASSAYYNLSLLSSDYFGLLFGASF